MADTSFLILSTELHYHIFDYLDINTILRSIRCVCTRFYAMVNNYHRFKLDLTSISETDLELISRLVPSKHIVSLTLRNNIHSSFDIDQFTRLQSLTLRGISDTDLERLLQHISTCSLISLSIYFDKKDLKNNTIISLFSSVIALPTLRKLHVEEIDYFMEHILFSIQVAIKHLTIDTCTNTQYCTMLHYWTSLQTLIINKFTMNSTGSMILPSSSSSTCYSQLISLSINDCELSMQNFEIVFSLTPSLNYLKIISTCRPMFDNVFYGSSWEKFIRVKLHQLKQFEFLFCYYLRNCDTNDEVTDCPILISEFQSPFWLNEKHWFVTSDFVIEKHRSLIRLYTMSIDISNLESLIIFRTSSTDNTRHLNILLNDRTKSYTSKPLTTLDVSSYPILDRGAKHLAIALQNNKTITELCLRGNRLDSWDLSHLAHSLTYNTTLTTLRLGGNLSEKEGTNYLADALRENRTLTTLELENNRIYASGARYLSDALRKNTTLTTLVLSENVISDKGAQYLATALQDNMTLITLDLTYNQITDDGIQHLAMALQRNTTLTTLELGSNKIKVAGAQYLACALQSNNTLTTLDLGSNQIRNEGAQHLIDVLENNTSLIILSLGDNQINTVMIVHIAGLLRRNKQLLCSKI